MTSESGIHANRTYVWVWLPGALAPVVAGVLSRDARGGYGFTYERSYLRRDDAARRCAPAGRRAKRCG